MTPEHEDLAEMMVGIDTVRPYPGNPRKGDIALLAESLKTNGQYRPIVVNRASGEILAGNHTWLAARKLGWSEIAATYVDVDDATARRIVLVDNRSADNASYDDVALDALLDTVIRDEGVEGLIGTGFDAPEIDTREIEEEDLRPMTRGYALVAYPLEQHGIVTQALSSLVGIEGVQVEQASN